MNKVPRYHLWIPENEIDNVSKAPTGRSKQYDLKHSEHGQKLSQDLQSIVEFFQHLQSSNSIDEQDLMVFKIILQEKEDFAAQKEFIENEGLTINAIKDGRRAIVSAQKETFDSLQGRVNRYKEQGTKKDFQYIESFEPFTAEDKQAKSMLRFIKDNPNAVAVDVQIMLLPDLKPDIQKRALGNITERIQMKHGTLQNVPYELTDGTLIIRASISPMGLNELVKDPLIYWVQKTVFFHSNQPVNISSPIKGLELDANINAERSEERRVGKECRSRWSPYH